MVSPDSEGTSFSTICSCCLGSKKRKSNVAENSLFQPSMVYSAEFPETVPKIVISNANSYALASARSDAFVTARTSRPEEASKYSSMTDLVQQIRSEAGLDTTPRINEEDEFELQGVTVSQLRIEGLAELHNNNSEPSLPSVSSEYYSSQIDSSRSQNSNGDSKSSDQNPEPSEQSLEPYQPSYSRKIGEMTFSIYTNFWRTYSLIVAFIALFLDKILPV